MTSFPDEKFSPEVQNLYRTHKESHTNPKLVYLTRSQLEVRNLAKLDPRSSGWTCAILYIESTEISYASIGLAMVSIHISHLIGQMRGTSHESETPWVGCIRAIDHERRFNSINSIIIMVGQKHHKVWQALPHVCL